MPAVVFGIGALVLIVFARRHRPRTTSASGESAKLTPAEAARLADIVSRGER
jgi:hypothetical protein